MNEKISNELSAEIEQAIETRNEMRNVTGKSLGDYICTKKVETEDEKVELYNAMQNPDDKISNFVNREFTIKDFIIKAAQYEKVDEETGEITVSISPYIIIFDEDGQTFTSSSLGVVASLKEIYDIFGHPSTWETPKKVVLRQKELPGGRRWFSFLMVK